MYKPHPMPCPPKNFGRWPYSETMAVKNPESRNKALFLLQGLPLGRLHIHSGKLTWQWKFPPFSIGNTSSIRVHFPLPAMLVYQRGRFPGFYISKVVSTHLWNTPLNLDQQAIKGFLSQLARGIVWGVLLGCVAIFLEHNFGKIDDWKIQVEHQE